jgi:hypothetical protein
MLLNMKRIQLNLCNTLTSMKFWWKISVQWTTDLQQHLLHLGKKQTCYIYYTYQIIPIIPYLSFGHEIPTLNNDLFMNEILKKIWPEISLVFRNTH